MMQASSIQSAECRLTDVQRTATAGRKDVEFASPAAKKIDFMANISTGMHLKHRHNFNRLLIPSWQQLSNSSGR